MTKSTDYIHGEVHTHAAIYMYIILYYIYQKPKYIVTGKS